MSRTSDRTYLKNRKKILHIDTCAICGNWINPEFKSPHPLSWSADHIHPVGRGGHNHGPLQAAHRDWNTRRKMNPPPPRHARQW